MVRVLLSICADLDNLTDLQPQEGCNDPNFTYLFKLKCGQCGEVTEKETCLSLNETVPSAKGKSDIHLSQKCKFCSREGTITMIDGRGRPLTLEDTEKGTYAPLMVFDCRGYEPLDFVFCGGWKAESFVGDPAFGAYVGKLGLDETLLENSIFSRLLRSLIEGTKFTEIDLSEGEFSEYDEKGECPVMISNLKAKFEVVKG